MLVTRTIKKPPDEMSTVVGTNYGVLVELMDLDKTGWIVEMGKYNVSIASQVERGEPEKLAVEEHSDTYTKYDSDTIEEAISAGYDEGEHTSVEGEVTGSLESDMECADGSTDGDTESVAATTGDNDQEDTSKYTEPHQPRSVSSGEDELDIQFVKVITT